MRPKNGEVSVTYDTINTKARATRALQNHMNNSGDERKAYNALALSLQGEYRAIEKTLGAHGSRTKALDTNPGKPKADPELEWERLTACGVKLFMRDETAFPAALREIPWPPFALYMKGAPITHDPVIAIVGTRKASTRGKAIAARFASELARSGVTVISGLALGIDRAAHEGALQANGKTVAVLANGLDRVYPREHERLAKNILEKGGTLISEYPLGSPSYPHRFIERNRLVSGLALGILIIEAPAESGALATARFALEQNRDVFVVPGEIDNPNYAGSHELLKQGAAFVTSPEDILRAIGIEPNAPILSNQTGDKSASPLDETSLNIVTILKKAGMPLDLDQITIQAGIDTPQASRTATLLVIKGIIKEQNGKYLI